MKQIPKEVIQEWAGKKKYIQDRLNKIKKRLKKYQKQEKHFELRLRLIKDLEKPQVKQHDFQGVGMAYGSVRYHCAACGSSRIDNNPPHHFPSWNEVSMDCDKAKKQVAGYDNKN